MLSPDMKGSWNATIVAEAQKKASGVNRKFVPAVVGSWGYVPKTQIVSEG
jgi:hypothetical protein